MTFIPLDTDNEELPEGEDDPDFEEIVGTIECANCGDEFELGVEGSLTRRGENFCSEDCAESYFEDEPEDED